MDRKKRPVVVLVEKIYHKATDVFGSVTDWQMVLAPAGEEVLAAVVREHSAAAVVVGTDRYTGPLYSALGKGGVIARFGVGYDSIDLVQAKQHSLFVTNTPGVLESTVAEYTLFLAAEVLRKCGAADRQMKNKEWRPVPGSELHGKTWAIVGYGKIGKQLANILRLGLGVNVLSYTRQGPDFSGIVAGADIVSLHLPASPDTYHFLNTERLAALKPGAILINTARGALVNENSLYDKLRDGSLWGAGLDVFENEPYQPVDPAKDLRHLSNVVLTPHIASSTVECGRRMAARVIRNIRFALEDRQGEMDIVSLSAPRGR